jgi:hypothetical protein
VSSVSPYKTPIVDLRAEYGKIRQELCNTIDEVADSQQFILGPAVERFEAQSPNTLNAALPSASLQAAMRVENTQAFFAGELCFHLGRACGKNFLTFSGENSWLNLKY